MRREFNTIRITLLNAFLPAGYEDVKEQIHNSVVLALQHPEVFDSITKGTRVLPASNRPKAILFEGEPGTGKTTAARIIAR